MADLEPITRDEKLWSGEDVEPITRREMYIKHLYDETQVIPDKPITREEMFILKAGEELHDVTIEQLTATENRTYSEEGVAYSPVIVNVPLPSNAYLLKDLSGLPADIATFTDGSDLPMPKLEIAVEPQQDLHGYDAPWAGGAGKNKFNPVNYESYKQADGSYRLTGVNSNAINNPIPSNVVGQEVTFSAYFDLTKEASPTYIRILVSVGGSYSYSDIQANTKGTRSVTFTPQSTSDSIKIIYGSDGSNYFTMSQLQLEIGNQVTSYLPYSNECPISGWSAVDLTKCGKNLFDADTIYSELSDGNGEFSVLKNGHYIYEYKKYIPSELVNKQLTFSAMFKGVENGNYRVQCNVNGTTQRGNNVNTSTYSQSTITFTPTSTDDYVMIDFNASQSGSMGGKVKEIQLEIGSTPTTYEPYNGQTITIQLGSTYYGGKLDVVSGVLTVDRMYKDLGNYNWVADTGVTGLVRTQDNTIKYMGNIISSQYIGVQNLPLANMPNGSIQATNIQEYLLLRVRDERLDGKTSTEIKTMLTGIQMVAELATPIEIQLTPTQVSSLMGVNNIFADCGDIIDGQYFSKGE